MQATFFLCGRSLARPHRFWWELIEAAADGGLAPADLATAPGWPAGERPPATFWDGAQTIQELDRSSLARLVEWLRERAGPDPDSAGMRTEQVRALAAGGQEIGFHTLEHPYLPTLEGAELLNALTEGRERLAEIAGYELTTFAYPHGGWTEQAVEAAREAGLSVAFTFDREPVVAGADPLRLGRMESMSSADRFALELGLLCATRP